MPAHQILFNIDHLGRPAQDVKSRFSMIDPVVGYCTMPVSQLLDKQAANLTACSQCAIFKLRPGKPKCPELTIIQPLLASLIAFSTASTKLPTDCHLVAKLHWDVLEKIIESPNQPFIDELAHLTHLEECCQVSLTALPTRWCEQNERQYTRVCPSIARTVVDVQNPLMLTFSSRGNQWPRLRH